MPVNLYVQRKWRKFLILQILLFPQLDSECSPKWPHMALQNYITCQNQEQLRQGLYVSHSSVTREESCNHTVLGPRSHPKCFSIMQGSYAISLWEMRPKKVQSHLLCTSAKHEFSVATQIYHLQQYGLLFLRL